MKAIIKNPGMSGFLAEFDVDEVNYLVGGYVQEYVPPYDNSVVFVMNESFLINGSKKNCKIRTEDSEFTVYGTFLIIGNQGTDYCGLTKAQAQKYLSLYKNP